MAAKARSEATKRVGDEAVKAKTGRDWKEWFAVLDAAGATKMSHTEMARYLSEVQRCPDWWSQMVAVAYEQERGLREVHQVIGGYQISVSRTFAAPVSALFNAWSDEVTCNRWLGEVGITLRKATPDKSIRFTWSDARTSVEVNFYGKGESRCQVTVQHSKLADASEAEGMNGYWKAALERLEKVL